MTKVIKKTTTIVEEHTSNDYTHIIGILDRSYSMTSIIDEAIGSYNNFLKEQQKLEGKATLTIALFDDQYNLLYDNQSLQKAKKLNRQSWHPRGMTALHDAIGKTINSETARIKKMKKADRPDKILVIIITDGEENASKEFTLDGVKKLTKKKEKKNWTFLYLGANQDAFEVGHTLGFSGGNTFTFTADSAGTATMGAMFSTAATNYRGMSTDSLDYSTKSANLIADVDEEEVQDKLDNTSKDEKED